jgi:septal ring factor EnvC (AmiA/AmiB activator)
VANHTISEHFGRHRNPIYGTVTPNLGVEIVTKPHAKVHVVHKGYVFAVRPLTGYGNVVFVSHGKYITAYGNLSRVTVRKNTILQEGQVVGYAGGKNSVRGASVFFMLRAGDKNVDPERWLKGE